MSTQLLVVGSVALDSVEAPAGKRDEILGGSASFFSVAASYFARPSLVAVVGEDFPEPHIDLLRQRGVDLAGLERVPGRSFRWAGRYSNDLNQRTTLDTQLNVFADFQPKLAAAQRDARYLFLANIHPSLQLDVLKQVERPRLVAMDTMNLWIQTTPAELRDVLAKVDLLVINDEEARQLAGVHNITKAAKDIRARGPKRLIIKRGEHGALLFDEHGTFFVPAYPLEDVVDPTGAGDTFAGGLLGYLARHGELTPSSLRRAMFFGSAVASFCVEGIGPRRLLDARKADLGHRIDGFARMVDYGGALALAD